jgi:hypothetical protein
MKAAKAAAKTVVTDTFESIAQNLKLMGDEAGRELNFLDPNALKRRPTEMAGADLARAREEHRIEEGKEADGQNSENMIQKTLASIETVRQEYRSHDVKTDKKQEPMQQELHELKEEVANVAKAAGIETKVHLQNNAKKIGPLDILMMVLTLRFLRIKLEDSKNAQDLVSQRSNAKRPTGMMAWVSGKQMKIHEQGTMQLQG